MKAKQVIATALDAMLVESTRTLDPHEGNIRAVITQIVAKLDALPDTLNVELDVIVAKPVEVKSSGKAR